MFYLLFLLNFAFAKSEPTDNFQKVKIYVDISEVQAPDGSKGTSEPVNIILSNTLQSPHLLRNRLQYWSNPHKWYGTIDIYDWSNIAFMDSYSKCDYINAIKCGVQNNHWTLRTVILVGDKYSTVTMKLYDNYGKIVGKGTNTTWGHIRWKPQWKLTKIKEQGALGGSSKEIFEMWPPKIEEIPPLIKPYNIRQASYGVYLSVIKEACLTKSCAIK